MNKVRKPLGKRRGRTIIVKGEYRHKEIDPIIKEGSEREAYYLLGRLTTLFADLEFRIQDFTVYLVMGDVFFGKRFIEGNRLEFNLQIIRDVNLFEEFEQDAVEDLIREIISVKKVRNTLIHGRWHIHPHPTKKGVVIEVTANKIQKPAAITDNLEWKNVIDVEYKLADIEKYIAKVEDFNERIKVLHKKLKALKGDED